jgi:hypothetical protein
VAQDEEHDQGCGERRERRSEGAAVRQPVAGGWIVQLPADCLVDGFLQGDRFVKTELVTNASGSRGPVLVGVAWAEQMGRRALHGKKHEFAVPVMHRDEGSPVCAGRRADSGARLRGCGR